MALTATANEECKADVVKRLNIDGCERFITSFNRPNLHYVVKVKRNTVIDDIANLVKSTHAGETGIIYAIARQKCEDIAKELRERHFIKAKHYHANMSPDDKRRTQDSWFNGQCQIIVATVRMRIVKRKDSVDLIFRLPSVWALTKLMVMSDTQSFLDDMADRHLQFAS
jgi:superfamily II DNA helicase RecQ